MNDGGPAFPAKVLNSVDDDQVDYFDTHLGLTKRDWFAGQAAKGSAERVCDFLDEGDIEGAQKEARYHAKAAWMMADALLAECEKGGSG